MLQHVCGNNVPSPSLVEYQWWRVYSSTPCCARRSAEWWRVFQHVVGDDGLSPSLAVPVVASILQHRCGSNHKCATRTTMRMAKRHQDCDK